MTFNVVITREALNDIFEIYRYVLVHDSMLSADRLRERIESTCYSLDTFPHRGHYPPELLERDIYDFREIHYKPYRIVYEIEGKNVNILVIADGRRDMQTLLRERLAQSS
jgi:toxin ParE1/3/4